MNIIKKIIVGSLFLGVSVASAATLSSSDVALRQQMIDFAKYFPNLVSQYYPDTPNVSQSGSPILGSLNGPDIPSPYLQFGGVRTWNYKVAISTSTTPSYMAIASTSCSIAAPFATSTITAVSYAFNTLASTSLTAIGWSIGPMATTTLLSPTSAVQNAGAPFPVTGSSTAASFIVIPSTRDANGNAVGSFINFKESLSQPYGIYPVGWCSVTFRETQ